MEYAPISSLIPDPSNVRKHSKKNLDAIKGSLAKFGQQKPIVISKDNVVIAGNGTLEAAIALKWDKIGIIRSELIGTEATAYAIADNRTGELAEWDNDALSQTLKSLTEVKFDLGSIGFDDKDLERLLKEEGKGGLTGDDEIPEKVETRCKVGDLWMLGEHRILCGDSTDINAVERLMGGEKVDITFTSPPYNAGCFGFQNGKSKYGKKKDDEKSHEDYFEFLKSFSDICLEKSQYVFINNQFLSGNIHGLAKFIGHYSDILKDVFPWIKNTAPPNVNKGVFTNRFEIVLCFEKGMKKKDFPVEWQGKFHNVIEGSTAAKENSSDGTHSATMPLYVIEWFIERLPFIKSVYEPFAGSGSTLIACEKTNRKCYGMEIDPHYCDLILKRWENFTGKEAVLLK